MTSLLSNRVRLRAALLTPVALFSQHPAFRALAAQDPTPASITEPLTLVVGGIDERGEAGEDVNSDVMMLARVDLQAKTVRAISIPRDLYVEIPNFGYDKITRAYDYGQKASGGTFEGGAGSISDTVSANFGLNVDGVVLTTFGGFQEIVDALGGVDVDNPYDVYDAEYPTNDYGIKEISFAAGPLHLSGEEALVFCRTRHQDGDDGRVMRQHLVIRGLLERGHDAEIGVHLTKLMKKHTQTFFTTLEPAQQFALALAAPGFSNDDVAFTDLLAYVYADTAPGGMWIYSGDWSQIPTFVESFLSGQ